MGISVRCSRGRTSGSEIVLDWKILEVWVELFNKNSNYSKSSAERKTGLKQL